MPKKYLIVLIILLLVLAVLFSVSISDPGLITSWRKQLAQTSGVSTSEKILTYWGPFVDATEFNNSERWSEVLTTMASLKDIGFTHNGVAVYDIDYVMSNPARKAVVMNRISQIRAVGLPLAIRISSGHLRVDNPAYLDPEVHASNGQSIKYYDSPGFDPLYNAYCPSGGATTTCPTALQPYATTDPAYTGIVWQQELALVDDLLSLTGLNSDDIVLFDTEIWSYRGPDWEHPNTIINSVGRYTGTLAERYAQYDQHWLARGHDLRDRVKAKNSDARALFYHENIASSEELSRYMLPGTGDAPSPSWELFPVLSKLQIELDRGDYSNSYPWLDFVDAYGAGRGTEKWDPKITQKAGLMMKQEGISGMIEYPGPFGRSTYPVADYLDQAEAFIRGFVDGNDPGSLVEVCDDEMDNDGDGEVDEVECPAPIPPSPPVPTPETPRRRISGGGGSSRAVADIFSTNVSGVGGNDPLVTPIPSLKTYPPLISKFGFNQRGTHVAQLQQMLTTGGVFSGPITSLYDAKTIQAVTKFQTKYGIQTTGVAGPLTRAKLNELYARGSQSLSTNSPASSFILLQQLLLRLQTLLKK